MDVKSYNLMDIVVNTLLGTSFAYCEPMHVFVCVPYDCTLSGKDFAPVCVCVACWMNPASVEDIAGRI